MNTVSELKSKTSKNTAYSAISNYAKRNCTLYVAEINKSGGSGYYGTRLLEMQKALGSLFGGYKQINIK